MLRRSSRLSTFRALVGNEDAFHALRKGKRRLSGSHRKPGPLLDHLCSAQDGTDAALKGKGEEHHAKKKHQPLEISGGMFAPRRISGLPSQADNGEKAATPPPFFTKLEDYLEREKAKGPSSSLKKTLRKQNTRSTIGSRAKPSDAVESDLGLQSNEAMNSSPPKMVDDMDKTESILRALSPDAKPRATTNPLESIKVRIRRPPSKDPSHATKHEKTAVGGVSFFSEVEQFLDKERTFYGHQQNKNAGSEQTKPEGTPAAASEATNNAAMNLYAPKKSIFDVFKVPEPAPPRSQNAFELEAYTAYKALLDAYIKESKDDARVEKLESALSKEEKDDVEAWMHLDEPKVKVQLPTLTSIWEGLGDVQKKQSSDESFINTVKTELQEQGTAFKKELGWSNKQYTYATTLIHALTEFSHENHKAHPVAILWEKIKEAGHMKKKTIGVCLEVATSFSGGVLSRNRSSLLKISPRNRLLHLLDSQETSAQEKDAHDNKDARHRANVPEQLALINDLLYNPTEHSTAIRSRRLMSLGDAENALNLIQERMTGEAKLRAYSQVFSLYLELGDISAALVLLQKLKKAHKRMKLQPELFVQLIATTAESGYFRHGSEGIETTAELPYSGLSGPGLFHELAREMSSYVEAISSASAKRLQKAFKRGFSDSGEVEHDFDVSVLAPLKPLSAPAADTEVLADRVSIDTSSGYCPCSQTSLRLIELETSQKNRMKSGILELVGKGRHTQAMQSFWDWLSNRTGPPFTVVVDGANVAYYMQNFDRGQFNFAQIEFLVNALEDSGEHPLVIVPQKYLRDSFTIATGGYTRKQTLNEADHAIIEGLEKSGRLYSAPQGCLDDYFWISATVIDQPKCERDSAKEAGPKCSKRLSSGSHPVVITNDQIRDHKQYELLEARAFNRWYSNTIVNYNFTGFVGEECIDPEIAFTPADKFSHEIQGNMSESDLMTWHFPVQDWETSDWFCIRIPSSPMKKLS